MRLRQRSQGGFTLVEMMITVCIVAILGSIALAQFRDYTRRAKISEIVMAIGKCKNTVAESYLTLDRGPASGGWGCESSTGSAYAGAVQTSSDGAIRVAINNLDRLVNGQYVYLVPAKLSGSPMTTSNDLGRGVTNWICGSDWQPVRNALPANCRVDTTTYVSGDFN
jgi:type IV pilus assembly protein PilA